MNYISHTTWVNDNFSRTVSYFPLTFLCQHSVSHAYFQMMLNGFPLFNRYVLSYTCLHLSILIHKMTRKEEGKSTEVVVEREIYSENEWVFRVPLKKKKNWIDHLDT